MIKISKRNPHRSHNNQLLLSKICQFAPLNKRHLRQVEQGGKQVITQNYSQVFHHKIHHQEIPKQDLYCFQRSKDYITYRFSQFDISPDNIYQTLIQDPSPSKLMGIDKINEKLQKRYSSAFTERNYPHKKWVQTIIRRKNNGSQGQIMKGLTGAKHEKVLEKAKTAIEEEIPLKYPFTAVQQSKCFIPLGSIIKIQPQKSGKGTYRMENPKTKLKVLRKRGTLDHQDNQKHRSNMQIRTQPEDFYLNQELMEESSRWGSQMFSKILRKSSNAVKNEKGIAPWEVQSFI